MPANRSRTDRWQECLHQIYERNGGLEIAPTRSGDSGQPGVDLVWRVRILQLTDREIVVEAPVSLNQMIDIPDGTQLTTSMSIGQNRWMFTTNVQGRLRTSTRTGFATALRLAMPTSVERCSRRNFMRVSTVGLNLPEVEVYQLLDPASAVLAEADCKAIIERGSTNDSPVMPTVGPMFKGLLLNLGGGGMGMQVHKGEGVVDSSRNYWLRINLKPDIPSPLGVCARICHTHLDHEQNTYCGVAFDFNHNPGHRAFVVDQITRFVDKIAKSANRKAA